MCLLHQEPLNFLLSCLLRVKSCQILLIINHLLEFHYCLHIGKTVYLLRKIVAYGLDLFLHIVTFSGENPTFLKSFLHCNLIFLKIIINALSFMWVAINGTTCWTALLLWLQVVWKEKNNALYRYSYNEKKPPPNQS